MKIEKAIDVSREWKWQKLDKRYKSPYILTNPKVSAP